MVGGTAGLLAGVANASPSRALVAPEKTLTCRELNLFEARPTQSSHVVLGRVALPTGRLLKPRYAKANGPLPYYAKAGLEVRSDREPFDVVIPAAWRSRAALGWGEDHGPRTASIIHVPRCPAVLGHSWVVWAGGYFLSKPACVPVTVRTAAHAVRVRLRIGRDCVSEG